MRASADNRRPDTSRPDRRLLARWAWTSTYHGAWSSLGRSVTPDRCSYGCQGLGMAFSSPFQGHERDASGLVAGLRTRQGGATGAGSYEVTSSRSWGPGTAGGSLAGQQGCGSRIEGQAVPGSLRALAGRRAQVGVDLAGDVTLEAADDFLLRQAFFGAPAGVGAGRRVPAQPGDHDPVQGVVGLAVPAGIEAVAGDLSRGCGEGSSAAQVRPGSLGAQPLGMVARGDQQHGRGVGADAVEREQARRAGRHQGNDQLIEAGLLAVQELGAAAGLA